LVIKLLIISLVGFLVGIINVIAGGGSFISLPVLIFLGLDPTVANGTNRIGILFQNISAVLGFQKSKIKPWKFSIIVLIPTLIGSIIGAYLAVIIKEELFKRLIAIFMILFVITSILYDPVKRQKVHLEDSLHFFYPSLKFFFILFLFLLIGVYGGFIQAGIGFLILSVVLYLGFNLVYGNAVKVFVVLFFTISALFIFIINGKVDFVFGFALAIGQIIGAQIGVLISVKKGHDFIKKIVSFLLVILAIRLFLS